VLDAKLRTPLATLRAMVDSIDEGVVTEPETIEQLAQKVYGIRSYANAFPDALDRAQHDHVDMITALRNSDRDALIALTRRHLEPSPAAYIRAYERRFGDVGRATNPSPAP